MTFSSQPERTPEIQALEAELMQSTGTPGLTPKCRRSGTGRPARRQAAKGRERLEALLSDFARSAEQTIVPFQPDLADLRRRLGLASYLSGLRPSRDLVATSMKNPGDQNVVAFVTVVDDVALDTKDRTPRPNSGRARPIPGCSARRSNRSMIASMSRSAVVGVASSAT